MTVETPLLPIPGWTLDVEARSYTIEWQNDRGHHGIRIAEVESGWTYVWMRYPTLTIAEAGPYDTLEAAMRSLWIEVFSMADRNHDLLVAEARRSLEAAKAT